LTIPSTSLSQTSTNTDAIQLTAKPTHHTLLLHLDFPDCTQIDRIHRRRCTIRRRVGTISTPPVDSGTSVSSVTSLSLKSTSQPSMWRSSSVAVCILEGFFLTLVAGLKIRALLASPVDFR